MDALLYNLSDIFPYFIVFLIVCSLLLVVLIIPLKKEISKNNIAYYGIFMNITKKDLFSFSLIIVHFALMIVTLFINEFSFYYLLFLFTPILLYGIISLDIVNMIVSLFGTVFMFVLCFFETIFYVYITTVSSVWYVIAILVILIIFIVAFAIFMLARNFNVILKRRMERDNVSFKK